MRYPGRQLLTALLAIMPLLAQPISTQFEVATIKEYVPSRTSPQLSPKLTFLGKSGQLFEIAGNRVSIQGTLHYLMQAAWDVKSYQVTAAPSWADTVLWTVTAKIEGDTVPTQEQVRPMMQALLSDRFQLKVHRESKEFPVYLLVPGKKTNGLKPAAADEKFTWNLTPAPGGMLRSKATRESIGDFVQLVGISADRPVIDRSGVTGFIDYDITINTPDAKSDDDVNRAILDAIRDQLGLKLEPAKAPIDVLVVDRVEKPSEN
jgi:uncharacterized protein (TIGR03435 family)